MDMFIVALIIRIYFMKFTHKKEAIFLLPLYFYFEIRLYKRFMDITTDSASILDFLLKTELPAGVSCSLKIL